MKRIVTLFFLLAAVGFSDPLNHYIRSDATPGGNGLTWSTAFNTFAAARSAGFTRGDTYYVAGGTYTEFINVDTNLSGVLWIYFKGATVADHGTGTGWNASYAVETTPASLVGTQNGGVIDVKYGYVSFDGQVGSGTSGHGFVIYNPTDQDNAYGIQLEDGGHDFEFLHCEIKTFATSSGATVPVYTIGVVTGVKKIHFQYDWIHAGSTNNIQMTLTVGTSWADYGALIEDSWITESGKTTGPGHGQGIQLGQATDMKYILIRNNTFRNIAGSAMVAGLTGASNINHSHWWIYNNIFRQQDLVNYTGLSPGPVWHEDPKGATGIVIDDFLIANNVFYNITGADNLCNIFIDVVAKTNVYLYNNYFEVCHFTTTNLVTAEANNGYWNNNGILVPPETGTASPFTSASTYDFTLVPSGYAVTNPGQNLYSSFTTYADGSARPNASFLLGPLPASGATASGSGASGKLVLSGVAHLY